MARTLTKDGFEDLTNRLCNFRNGKPVNMPQWDAMKQIPEIAKKSFTIHEVSIHQIKETFNPIIDSFTGRILHSSLDRFKIFCKENGLEYAQENISTIKVRYNQALITPDDLIHEITRRKINELK